MVEPSRPKRANRFKVVFICGESKRQGSTTEFDEGGMFIHCQEPFPIQSRVKVLLFLPDLKRPMELGGEVVWSNIHGPDDLLTPRGMGVKFTNLDSGMSRALAEFSEQYLGRAHRYRHFYS